MDTNHPKNSVPLVSVIMSVYNDEAYVVEAIKSILHQDYDNLELIVIDDASSDNSAQVIQKLDDERIVFLQNQSNMKLAHNLNVAISLAKGAYIARMDADDIAEINRISEQVKFMEDHPDIDVVGSYAMTFGDYSIELKYPIDYENIKVELLFENAFCHPSVMFRKSTLDFRYDESFSASQDYELWARIVWNKKMANLPLFLMKYRVHQKQTRNTNGNKQKAGAIAARSSMLSHIIAEPSKEFMDAFNNMFSISTRKDSRELQRVYETLTTIIKENNKKKIFDEGLLFQKAASTYYLNWYYSYNMRDIKLSDIMKTVFKDSYVSQPLIRKIKIFINGLLRAGRH